MNLIQVKTNGNASPQGKPRVYVTCHPADVELWFDKICEDIFKAQDCAIYYKGDMSEEIPDEYKETDLGRMNLFVIPVTFRLLTTKNRCIDSDFPFAVEKHIPILPVMMESGIDEFYGRIFGERQYLNPFSRDQTEIVYEEKLKKFLKSVLVDDETATRIRAAFDAYIFLSYRKKDRRYANELMRMIHSQPLCRDIAIWYDEFLTPGESFNSAIFDALQKSELFTLLVTPNLVNEENYVRTVEYPAARDAGKDVFPVIMVETDNKELARQFKNIPPTVDAHCEEEFRKRWMETISKIAISSNDDDPAHNYLIGLAYLEGIDVEVDRPRALELIASAAEAGLPEAMEKLADMYGDGSGAEFDYYESLKWRQRLYDHMVKTFGEKHSDTIATLNNLNYMYVKLGNYEKALELQEKAYMLGCEVLGEKHPDTLTTLNNLASAYGGIGEYFRELELQEKAYALRKEVLGEKHPSTLISLGNLANVCFKLEDYAKALELHEKSYAIHCEVLGERHPNTLASLNNLACAYGGIEEYARELELQKKAYDLRKEVLGEKHPSTIISLGNLACTYAKLEDYTKTLKLQERVYNLCSEVLSEKHPYTIKAINDLADAYWLLEDYETESELREKAYALSCEVLGEKHPYTVKALNDLADAYRLLEDYETELELKEKVYELSCEALGEKHPDTLAALSDLADAHYIFGEYDKVSELREKAYELSCEILGEKHRDTLTALNYLSASYEDVEDYVKALEAQEKLCVLLCEVYGKTDLETLVALDRSNQLRAKI